jgi:hypothetical protein
MNRYRDARDLRRAIEARLRQESLASGKDLNRLRRRVVFDRLATRLATAPDGSWVLKGGAALEFRLLNRARATRDLDLVLRADRLGGAEVRETLIEALAADPDHDGFAFHVGPPTAHVADSTDRPGWRFPVEALLAGKTFDRVRLDVVARREELARTEHLLLPGILAFAEIPARSIEAVDRRQHFAEKLHALTRDYADRANTRIKDLADLVLLIETGLVADATLASTVRHVFAVRGTHPLPTEIPSPPPSWRVGYPEIAAGLTHTSPDLDSALAMLRSFWATALDDDQGNGQP